MTLLLGCLFVTSPSLPPSSPPGKKCQDLSYSKCEKQTDLACSWDSGKCQPKQGLRVPSTRPSHSLLSTAARDGKTTHPPRPRSGSGSGSGRDGSRSGSGSGSVRDGSGSGSGRAPAKTTAGRGKTPDPCVFFFFFYVCVCVLCAFFFSLSLSLSLSL